MPETDRIVVVAAGQEERGRDALALGASLARLRDARLLLAGVFQSPLGGDGLYQAALREETERDLALLRREAPAGVEVATRVLGSTSVARGLHDLAEEVAADVLVIGPSHLGAAARAVRGDVALQAIHAAPCAVAVAPAGHAAKAGAQPLRHVGAAFDGSPESTAALAVGAELAARAGGELLIVDVVDVPYVFADPPVADETGRQSHIRIVLDEVRERLEDARRGVGEGLPTTTAMPEGDAVGELVAAAAGLDLLVMGSRGYGPVRRVLLGSVVAGVLHHAPCPVLVLPRGAGAAPEDEAPAAAAAGSA